MAVVVTAVSTTDTSTMTELARPVHEKATSAASCHVNMLGPKVLEQKVLGPKSTESESESRWIWGPYIKFVHVSSFSPTKKHHSRNF